MVTDMLEALERADEFLGRVPIAKLDEAASKLDHAGYNELARVVLDAASQVAAARRSIARVKPERESGFPRRKGHAS